MPLPKTCSAVSIAGALAALCSACANPAITAGSAAGAAAGGRIADRFPPPAAVAVEPRGGRFCPVMEALGWPPEIGAEDRLTPPLAGAVVGALEHGEEHCGWKPPGETRR